MLSGEVHKQFVNHQHQHQNQQTENIRQISIKSERTILKEKKPKHNFKTIQIEYA